jgi:hypothetical protein
MRKELLDGMGTVCLKKGSYQEEYQNIIRWVYIAVNIMRVHKIVKNAHCNE